LKDTVMSAGMLSADVDGRGYSLYRAPIEHVFTSRVTDVATALYRRAYERTVSECGGVILWYKASYATRTAYSKSAPAPLGDTDAIRGIG
jgi:hypothetical protein